VKRDFLDIIPQGLRYIVTKMFYDRIRRCLIRKKNACDNNTTNKEKTVVASSQLFTGNWRIYWTYRREKVSRTKKMKIYHTIEQRRHKFYKKIYTTIENKKDKEINPYI
jgi:hypothetical protein